MALLYDARGFSLALNTLRRRASRFKTWLATSLRSIRAASFLAYLMLLSPLFNIYTHLKIHYRARHSDRKYSARALAAPLRRYFLFQPVIIHIHGMHMKVPRAYTAFTRTLSEAANYYFGAQIKLFTDVRPNFCHAICTRLRRFSGAIAMTKPPQPAPVSLAP